MKEPKNIKSKYGKDSEAANAHIQTLISPPTITSSNPHKINEFYEKTCHPCSSSRHDG